MSGLAQQLSRAFRIVGIHFDVACKRPIVGRQHAGRRSRLTAPKILDDTFAVDAVSEGLPHTDVLKDRIRQIKCNVLVVSAGAFGHVETVVAPQHFHHVRRQGIHGEVDAALLQFQGDDNLLRNHLETKHRHAGFLSEVGIVSFQNNFLILDMSNELEWPRSDGMAIEVRRRAFRNDADNAIRQIPQERRKWFLELKDYCLRIGRLQRRDQVIRVARLNRAHRSVQNAAKREADVVRRKETTVMKANIVAEVKDIGQWIRHFPSQRKIRHEFGPFIPAHEGAEHQTVETLRRRVLANPRVEIVGSLIERNGHDAGVCRGLRRAGGGQGEKD